MCLFHGTCNVCTIFSFDGSNKEFLFYRKRAVQQFDKPAFQDSRGFIWVATEYGLNRFDGLNFSNYRHVPNDSVSLTSDYVRTLFEDSRQNLLIGCINGLMVYNRETDTFREIPMIRAGKRVTPTCHALARSP